MNITIKGTPVLNIDDHISSGKPGTFSFYVDSAGSVIGMHFICPCGCGKLGGVKFGTNGWSWNGCQDKPTVAPSIYFRRGEPGEWHGYLVDGVFTGC